MIQGRQVGASKYSDYDAEVRARYQEIRGIGPTAIHYTVTDPHAFNIARLAEDAGLVVRDDTGGSTNIDGVVIDYFHRESFTTPARERELQKKKQAWEIHLPQFFNFLGSLMDEGFLRKTDYLFLEGDLGIELTHLNYGGDSIRFRYREIGRDRTKSDRFKRASDFIEQGEDTLTSTNEQGPYNETRCRIMLIGDKELKERIETLEDQKKALVGPIATQVAESYSGLKGGRDFLEIRPQVAQIDLQLAKLYLQRAASFPRTVSQVTGPGDFFVQLTGALDNIMNDIPHLAGKTSPHKHYHRKKRILTVTPREWII